MILSISGISFCYKSRQVLKDVSFALKQNELLAILGPNGVGKTTLLKCINAILRPQGGSVLVEGRDISSLSRMEIAKDLAYVPQRGASGRLTAFDAILLGRRPHIQWKVRKKDLEKVDAIIKTLGLEELSLRFLDEMSGGELQKVNIARALVQEPKVLLLDEPTSSLDLRNQQEILKTIRHIVTNHDMAAVMTMHDLGSALRFADKALFMKNGVIYSASSCANVTPAMVEAVYGVNVAIERIKGHPVVVPL
ncbi:ABC transporter ATP-binding protein [Acetomicrobium sp. S15 = DSM 107314]|jgi:iron complex transport system ATP-binding protein|uniref:ABC transporter ATP-binding protein n=1 Tax=Acetomicrobium sp. S15 = DSM 107314 TaxID=2529858 RepID=UPI0018E14260|nr:ABC transporter ATP-binding protein [Acetomicrobium sp. S15 = DSM 107314]